MIRLSPNMRRTCVLVAMLLASISGCSQLTHRQHQVQAQAHWDQVRAKVKLQLATQLYETGHARDAARSAQQAVALDPASHDAYHMLARSQLEIGDLSGTNRTLQAAEYAGLKSAALTYLHGVLEEQRGELARALERYQEARRIDPNELDYMVATTECLVTLGDLQGALDLIQEHRRALDRDGTLATLGACVAQMLGNSTVAEQMYRDAIRASGSPSISLDYGLMLVGRDRYAEARLLLEPLLRDPLEGMAQGALRRALARCHLALSEPDKAQGVLEDYLAAHGDDQAAQLLHASAALALKDHHAVLRASREVLLRDPSNPDALLAIATVHLRENRREAAERAIQEILDHQPEHTIALALRRRLNRQ